MPDFLKKQDGGLLLLQTGNGIVLDTTIYDQDAAAGFQAAGITDTAIRTAVNTFITNLKSDGLWNLCHAVYIFAGGSATAHQWNWRDVRKFNLTFAGNITHSLTGMLPDGTTGYANTKFTPALNFSSATSCHVSFYSRTNVAGGDYIDIGCQQNVPVHIENCLAINNSGSTYPIWSNTSTEFPNAVNSDSRGFYLTNRVSGTNVQGWRNGSKIVDAAQSGAMLVNVPIGINCEMAENSAQSPAIFPSRFSPRECAFASIGDGLTDAQAALFSTRVNALQTALSRSVY